MNAVVLEAPEQLAFRSLDTPTPGDGDVLIKVGATSICGSDLLRVYAGHAKVLPIVLGHESAGEIVAVGAGVSPDRVGERVALAPLVPNMAHEIAADYGLYGSAPGYSFIGSRVNGGFAEYVVAPAGNAIPLPDGVPTEIGALLEPCTVAYHSLKRGGGVAGKRVAVLGVGSIGLLTVQMARALDAAQIIAVDIADHRLAAAAEFGASVTINPRTTDPVAAVMDATGLGADVTLEVAGVAATLELSVPITRPGGEVVLVGNQPKDATIRLEWIEQIMRRQLNLHGALMSYSPPFPGEEWSTVLDLMAAGKLNLEAMISHRIQLAELPDLFAQIHAGALVMRKVIVAP